MTTDTRYGSPTAELDRLTIRHTGRKPPLAVAVHLADGRTLAVEANAAQLQTIAKLQALVAHATGTWLSWERENERPRVMREDWAETVKNGFESGKGMQDG